MTENKTLLALVDKLHAMDRDLPDCAEYCPKLKELAERIENLEGRNGAAVAVIKEADVMLKENKDRIAQLEAGAETATK